MASSPGLLKQNKGDLWDSGKTEASRSFHVRYSGNPLPAGTVCYWKVRSWDHDGRASDWSEIAKWEVALANPADWDGAKWIDDGKDNPTRDQDFYKPDSAPLLREEFEIMKPVAKARLHVAGLGLCYPSLNGERISDQVFDPQWTRFDKRILYRTHDVSKLLQEGVNCIGLELGNGWYNPLPMRMWGRRNLREALPVGRPRAIAYLVVDFTDGSQITVKTGPSWKTSEGPTIRNNIYLGELHDARRAIPGWNKPGHDESGWRSVRVQDKPLETLMPLIAPPVRLAEPFQARSVSSPETGTYIVDFGRNFTGLPEIDLEVPEGTEILFRYGEILDDDGSLNPLTSACGQIRPKESVEGSDKKSVGGPGAPITAWQQDIYIARGGGETYRPNFTFHAFRYMEITGLPYKPRAEQFSGYPIRSDLQTRGKFASSNELLNRIQELCLNTFLANVVTVQSDCPHRERFAYGGDIVATSDAFFMNFDMKGFYAKTVRDWADSALPDGRLTDTAPFVGIDYCGVGWAKVHPLLLEQLHQYYGAYDLIEEQLPVAMRWLDAEAARRENDLVKSGLGDHEALTDGEWGSKLTTPVFIDSARRIARLARIVDETELAERAEAYAEESLAAWKIRFLDAENGIVAEGTQTAQTFALAFAGLAPETQTRIFQRLVGKVTEIQDAPRLTTGIFGTRILLEELSKRGRSDLAYGLATREAFPSWAWMLANDATTLWEAWDVEDRNYSLNHPMFGSISAWFYRWLGGIQPADDAVAFDRFYIRPQVQPELKWVKSAYRSVRGNIVSNWSTKASQTKHEIVIPPNTVAIIELPAAEGSKITEGGKALNRVKGINLLPGKSKNTVR
ncbi:MAG: family 78 glycoside hydrolase catalytic domain, partial [Opitutales bacterium]